MGDVYRARTFGAEGVQKDLCLKLIREPRLRQPDALARFIREARLWVKLQHGTIVAVFDFGRSGSDYYLAMEWVDGADAGSLVGSAPLPGHVAAHVAAEVARALDYAHGEGVVHCDVKPANVLISRAGDVKLADFGLARAIGTEAGGGTPGYAAPEQRAGDEVDARADLFSLGVLLTALATGGRDPSELEGRLAEHVAHLTQTDRNARPPDAATVANALEGFVAEKRAGGALSPREVLSQRARDADPEEREARAQLADARSLLALDEDSMRSTVSAPSVPEPVPSPSRWKRVLPLVALLFAGLGAWGLSTTPRGGTDAAPPSASGVADAPPLAPAPAAVMNEPSPTSASEAPEPEAASGNATAVHAREAPRRATRRAPAHVSINAIPWARVRIDGRDAGITPLLDVALPAGRHVVSLENDALGVRDVRVLRLSPGASERLVVTLAP